MNSVEIVDPVARAARVIVPDYQLSLAIGKEGQNARLAAKLTGWRIDIRPDTAVPDGGDRAPAGPRRHPAPAGGPERHGRGSAARRSAAGGGTAGSGRPQ